MKKILLGILVLIIVLLANGIGKVFLQGWLNSDPEQTAAPSENEASKSRFLFKSKECGYSVLFPRKPDIKLLDSQKTTYFQQAQLIEQNHMIRASCMVYGGSVTFDDASRQGLVSATEQFAERQGIRDPVINYSKSELGQTVILSGNKRVRNTSFKFKYRFYYRGSRRFTVIGSGLASGYPQEGILEAYNSVARLASGGS